MSSDVPLPGDHDPIQGPRLRLRPIMEADLPSMFRWLSDPAVAEFYGEPPRSAESLQHYLEPDVQPVWRFIIEAGKEGIGEVQYHYPYWGQEYEWPAGIDIYIGAAANRERGLGTEAVRTMLQHLFESNQVHIVTIDPEVDNKRAIRCYERAGFRRDGVLCDHAKEHGRYINTYYMSILADEWPRAKAAWLHPAPDSA